MRIFLVMMEGNDCGPGVPLCAFVDEGAAKQRAEDLAYARIGDIPWYNVGEIELVDMEG